jgi:hypothetical protein
MTAIVNTTHQEGDISVHKKVFGVSNECFIGSRTHASG